MAVVIGDVIVVGGGVIGTAVAWRAARAGKTVTLIDPGGDDPLADDKASLVAAGMLGPVSESVFGEQHLLNLNLHAVGRFPSFNAELEEAAGQPTGLRTEGTLAVAYDSGDLAALDRLTDFRHSVGLAAERLDAREVRRREPFLAPNTKGGVLAAGDLSVDNRRYLAALRAAAAKAGVQTIAGRVTEVADGRVRLLPPGTGLPDTGLPDTGLPDTGLPDTGLPDTGLPDTGLPDTGLPDTGLPGTGSGGADLTARHVVIAAGHATGAIDGIPGPVRTAIRPVKGQILRLRHPANIPHILTRTVRAIVQGHDLYLVPRRDGELVVGATQEERGDRDVTAGAVYDLLRDATTAVPAVSELIFAEANAGLRPGTSDNGPILGPLYGDGLIIAAGHFRNGIMLSAVTADAVTAILLGEEPDAAWTPFRPGRFTGYGPPGPGVPPGHTASSTG